VLLVSSKKNEIWPACLMTDQVKGSVPLVKTNERHEQLA
jgi:hypothetical protein